MSKRVIVFLLLVALCFPAVARGETVMLIDNGVLSCEFKNGVIFTPWGCATGGDYIISYHNSGNNNGFESAYMILDDPVLIKNEVAHVEAVTVGGVAPFIYEWDIYYQPFAREVRSYVGELHEVSLNSYLDFTPRKEGRYIIVVKVSDSKGNYVTFDSDAVPTDKNGEITAIIEGVAADATATGTEIGAVKHIYNWIIDNAEYSTTPADYEADSIFLKGCGVCSGYASAFNMLCAACGIESFSVHGYACAQPMRGKEHSWNCVRIDGDWYFLDITRDDNNALCAEFLMTSATCEQSYCFGIAAAGASPCGGACIPPRCNATLYVNDYADDPVATAVYITANGEPVGDNVLQMSNGDSARIVCATAPSCSRHAAKVWTTSNERVVRVTNTGILYACGVGHCIITVTCGELSAKVEIIVK